MAVVEFPRAPSKASSGETLRVQAGKVRAFHAALTDRIELSRRAEEAARAGPHPVDWWNPHEGSAEDFAEFVASAKVFTDLVVLTPGAALGEEEWVAMPIEPMRAWMQSLMREAAGTLKTELTSRLPSPHRVHARTVNALTATQLFRRRTGLTLKDLGMVAAEVVEYPEFLTYQKRDFPWWLRSYCKYYGGSPADALRTARHFAEPEFMKEFPEEHESLYHFFAVYAWLDACKCLRYIGSDEELGRLARELTGFMNPESGLIPAKDLTRAARIMLHFDAQWRERHGEPPGADSDKPRQFR